MHSVNIQKIHRQGTDVILQILWMKFLQASFFFAFLQFSSVGFAFQNFEGIYLKKPDGFRYLMTQQNQEPLHITSSDPRILRDLNRLHDGDYINLNGEAREQLILVNAINFIGLSTLIGTWKSKNMMLFNFKDFTNLTLFAPLNAHSSNQNWKDFVYNLVPGNGEKWTIFIVNHDSINIGRLFVEGKDAKLEVINTNSGKPQEIFDLERID